MGVTAALRSIFSRRHSIDREVRGSAFIEFILTLPIVTGLLFGTLSVGFTIYTHQKNSLVARELANIVLRRCSRATSEGLILDCIRHQVSEMLSAAPTIMGPNPRITLRYGRCSTHQCVTCAAPPCSFDGFDWMDGNGDYLSELTACSFSSTACSCSCGESPENPTLMLGDLMLGGMIMTQAGTAFYHASDDIGRLYEDIWEGGGTPDEKASLAKSRFWAGDQVARGNADLMTARGFAIEVDVATDFIQPRPWDFGILRAHEEVVF